MVQITKTGVTGKTLSEYRDDLTQRYLSVDPQWNLLPESPDGQIIAIWSEVLAAIDEQVQYAYMSRDPATATGQALYDIGEYADIQPKEATPSTATVTITGSDGTVVPEGSRVRQKNTGTLWSIDSDVTISGPTIVNVTSVNDGQITAPQNTLTEIADPVAGWQSVTNTQAAALGRPRESDSEYRLRRNQSVSLPGSNQIDNIFSAVLNVDGVTQCKPYENPSNTSDVTPSNPNGLNANSIAVIVQGGSDEDVMRAIAAKKNPGCNMNYGAGIPNEITGNVTTPLGNPVNITFFRPQLVTIYVSVSVETNTLPDSVKSEIKQAIVDFSLFGLTGQGDGFTRRGFQIGERASAGRLHTPVNEIVGGDGFVDSLLVGISPSPGSANVSINFNQLAVFDISNITVEYV